MLYQVGIEAPYWFTNATYAFIALLIVYTWHTIPQIVLFVYPAIISIAPEYHEAAAIDGASKLQVLWYITLPLIRPAMLVALVFRTIFAVRVFGEILVLTNGGPFRSTEVLSLYLYKEGFVYFSWGTAAAVGWIMLIITVVVALPQIRLLIRQMYD
jgi:multiple sugar transport system permease protein